MVYNLVLFIHVVGALGLFVGIAGIVMGMYGMRRAQTVKQFREWSWLASTTDKAMPFLALSIVLPGVYLVWSTWGWRTAWADVALASFVALVALGPLLIGPRLIRLKKLVQATPDLSAPVPDALRAEILDPLLWLVVLVFAAVALGIVFLMTVKPDLLGSLATIAATIALGVIGALPLWRIEQPGERLIPQTADE